MKRKWGITEKVFLILVLAGIYIDNHFHYL